LPPPTLGERGHRGLARLGVAVRRRAILMMPEDQRPHPRRYSTLGARLATNYLLQNGMAFIPRVSVAWQHAFGDVSPTAALSWPPSKIVTEGQ